MGDKDNEFKKLGYKLEDKGNYVKKYPFNKYNSELIAQEIKIIFETIYNVDTQYYEMTFSPY